ncbi:hypothetical protein U1Q18_001421 [Sarracenia purpurea var. burkii]
MIRGKNGNPRPVICAGGDDDESAFSNCRESTARGMFSWSGLHLDWWGGCALYMMARSTAETVGMYAVLFRASNQSSETLSAASISGVPAIALEIPDCGGRRRIPMRGDIEGGGAAEGGDLVEPNSAEAEDGVAGGVGLGNVDVAALQRVLEGVDALLRVVRHHGQIGGRRRLRRRDLEGGASVSGEQPRREHRTAPTPVEVLPASVLHTAEELRRQIQPAHLRFRLNWKRRDRVRRRIVSRLQRLCRFGEQTGE